MSYASQGSPLPSYVRVSSSAPDPPLFEVMRDMVYNLPVLTPPRWVRSRTTPIALENLLYYLVELLNHPAREHRVFEAAGPDILSYQQQFTHFYGGQRQASPVDPYPLSDPLDFGVVPERYHLGAPHHR